MHEELKKIMSEGMTERYEFEQKLIERAWEDEAFKQKLLSNPKAVFEEESGEELPKSLEIEVLQESANKVYLVLPNNPASAIETEGELSEEALESVAGGSIKKFTWSCIGSIKKWTAKCKASGNGLV